ncbi:MAG: nucleotidyltransferase domain-containing protein [Deltaproteobacteria bacterium]|jgi:predicted nucleotidyltransferase|nr:nucleotidyltransferase domain-containing protein [Deltaproteobacteria bacterium]
MERIINTVVNNNLAEKAGYLSYLTDDERTALTELKEKVTEKYPGAKLILYGSKARGDYNEESDIDLLIVINDDYKIDKDISFEELKNRYFMRVSKDINEKILGIVVDIELKYDIFIDWQIEYKSYLNTRVAGIEPWYQNIKREGIEL